MAEESKPVVVVTDEYAAAANDLWSATVIDAPALAVRVETAKAKLAELNIEPGHDIAYQVGDEVRPIVTVRRGSGSFDPRKAAAVLPKKQYQEICVPVPDLTRAAEVLTPAEYNAICIPQPDLGLATAVLPPERLALLCDLQPSAKLAEEMLTPKQYESCVKRNDPVIMALAPKKGK